MVCAGIGGKEQGGARISTSDGRGNRGEREGTGLGDYSLSLSPGHYSSRSFHRCQSPPKTSVCGGVHGSLLLAGFRCLCLSSTTEQQSRGAPCDLSLLPLGEWHGVKTTKLQTAALEEEEHPVAKAATTPGVSLVCRHHT
ncbi:hypothetical protein C0Q70_00760 [Pomacea canaliculata]|uniref:Uncharacterized protein n=1 Tax=Pomacea canaliculata TaxID=400727 RepID=A0A2T7PXL4_POMCA|nr:hypothetical protein C0Q70_00760 [Pomacea canaliculata]